MSERKNDEPQPFFIPPNFARKGTLFGGAIKIRNLIEAAILGLPLMYLLSFLPFQFQYNAMIIIFIVGPICAFAIFGINDSPLSVFLKDWIKFHLEKSKYEYYTFQDKLEENSNNKKGGK